MEGFAVSSVNINGVEHEFSAIDGVKEDVVEMILNLKQIRFKTSPGPQGPGPNQGMFSI